MCLITKLESAIRADRDMVCYKVVSPGERGGKEPNQFIALVMNNFTYMLGETYKEKKFKPYPDTYIFNCRAVQQGFHSFATYADVRRSGGVNTIWLKCIIPAGSLYFYDKHCSTDTTPWHYCSDTIKVIAWKSPRGKWSRAERTADDIGKK